MANIIRIKRSTVPGKVPLAGDLEVGELAVNTADGALYTKHNDSTVKQISANLATVTLDYVATNGNTTSRALSFTNNTVSSSSNTGAVVVTGGLGVGGNVHSAGSFYAEGFFYAGNLEPVGSSIELAPANIINSNVTIGTANSATLIDSVSVTGISSVKWSLVAVDSVNNYFKSSQINSVNDGSNVYYNEFGVVLSNNNYEVVSFSSNIDNGNIRLYGIVESANTIVTFQRTSLGSATVSGDATAQTLSAQKGYTGSQGSTGYTGSAGSQGSTGYTGSAGSQGPIGYTGSRGDIAMVIAASDENSTLTTGTSKVVFRAPFAMNLTQIPRASLRTASTSGNVVVDINENGTSILGTNKLLIDPNEKTSTTAVTATTLTDTSIADDAEITVDIDSAGTNAAGLKITLYYTVA